MTMVPEAWQGNSLMSVEKQDYYRWISCTMEAWDGPGMYCVERQLYYLLLCLASISTQQKPS